LNRSIDLPGGGGGGGAVFQEQTVRGRPCYSEGDYGRKAMGKWDGRGTVVKKREGGGLTRCVCERLQTGVGGICRREKVRKGMWLSQHICEANKNGKEQGTLRGFLFLFIEFTQERVPRSRYACRGVSKGGGRCLKLSDSSSNLLTKGMGVW